MFEFLNNSPFCAEFFPEVEIQVLYLFFLREDDFLIDCFGQTIMPVVTDYKTVILRVYFAVFCRDLLILLLSCLRMGVNETLTFLNRY